MSRVSLAVRATRRRPCARGEGGYVAIMTGLLMVVFVGLAAIAVDLGRAYVVGQQGQRAADAAALAGVVSLPGDQATAKSTALQLHGAQRVHGRRRLHRRHRRDRRPPDAAAGHRDPHGRAPCSRRCSVTRPRRSRRTAVADYAGPVPMGSPCNEYGDDPEPGGHRSANCTGTGAVLGQRGQPQGAEGQRRRLPERQGQQHGLRPQRLLLQRHAASTPSAHLQIEAFDPAFVDVGRRVHDQQAGGRQDPARGEDGGPGPARPAMRTGPSASAYCTGDVRYGGTGQVRRSSRCARRATSRGTR